MSDYHINIFTVKKTKDILPIFRTWTTAPRLEIPQEKPSGLGVSPRHGTFIRMLQVFLFGIVIFKNTYTQGTVLMD